MEDIQQIRKAFREARIVGKQLLDVGKITWQQYASVMMLYEDAIKSIKPELYDAGRKAAREMV